VNWKTIIVYKTLLEINNIGILQDHRVSFTTVRSILYVYYFSLFVFSILNLCDYSQDYIFSLTERRFVFIYLQYIHNFKVCPYTVLISSNSYE